MAQSTATLRRLALGTRLRLAELGRQPVTLALLVLLPPVVIETYGVGVEAFPQLPGLGTDPATAGRMAGALFSVAFLAGLVGLFQVISARRGDERLALAGFPRWAMLVARLVTMAVLTVAGALAAFVVFTYHVDVAAPAIAIGVLILAGLVYGLLGIVIGTLLPRELEGSLVLVFLADVDNALSSGLFAIDATIVELAPLYHANKLFKAAVLDGTLATEHLWPTVGHLGMFAAVAFVAYATSTGDRLAGVVGRWKP
ncbi:hypothetical protein ACKVMT_12450 [Halobacteriales archaeon Cl-PHB]